MTENAPGPLPLWEQRFRATRTTLPEWAEDAPHRCLFGSNATGTFELYAWDRAAGTTRQVTDRANGTSDGALPPDGAYIWWFDDSDGDELGVWRRQAWEGGPDVAAVPGVPAAYSAGLAIGRSVTVVGCSSDAGSTVYVATSRPDESDGPGGGRLAVLYAHREDADVSALSRDERLVALDHSEHGDSRHKALRVVTTGGEVVGELADGPGLGLTSLAFSPLPGDPRLLALHERTGRPLPFLWNAETGEQVDLDLTGLPGDLTADWYEDGSALLVHAEHRGRSSLHRLDLASGGLEALPTPAGTVSNAAPRPDGSVEYTWSSAASPPVVLSTDGGVVLSPSGPAAPGSVAVEDVVAPGPGGEVHALLARPEGSAPYPTVFLVHGGPTWHDSDAFASDRAAYVDLGCAVVEVNYRGSTGYGRDWRDALTGRPGLTELEDIAAVRALLVEQGVVDAARVVLAGGSWGGYLTLLGLGTQPGLWAAGVAAVPVADYVAAYEDEMDELKAFDRSLFGGDPQSVPDVYAASSPLTYVAQVKAPVLVLAGANDPRCPIRQIENWLAAAAEAGRDVEVYRFDAGHGSLVVDERVRQMRAELRFVARRLALTAPA